MSSTFLLDGMEKNLYLQMTYFIPFTKAMELKVEDCAILSSDVEDDGFNYILKTKFSNENIQEKIEKVKEFYRAKKVPYSWWVGPQDTPSNLKEVLINYGFLPKEYDYGMYLPLEKYTSKKKQTLAIKRVETTKDLETFFHIYEQISGSREAYDTIFSKIPASSYASPAPYSFYLGYNDQKPVVSGVSVISDQSIGIYYIMTIPEERRKGWATQMMEFILQKALDEKMQFAFLQASTQGRHVYSQMGFIDCGLYQEFCPKEFFSSSAGF